MGYHKPLLGGHLRGSSPPSVTTMTKGGSSPLESTAPLLPAWTSAADLISHVLNIFFLTICLFCFVLFGFGLVWFWFCL